MRVSLRQQSILDHLRERGQVRVEDLAQQFDVSPQAIRKDLNALSAQHRLVRSHGGALLARGSENVEYESRRQIAAAEKAAIGQRAAALIPDAASLFVNIGTTTEAVGEALVAHSGLMIVTNNINVANRLRLVPSFSVIIAGGQVRGSDGGIVGEAAVDFIRQFKVDYAIIGISAIDPDGALLDFDLREVKVTQAIIANARHVVLAADSTKLERAAPIRVGHLSDVDIFVTDATLPAALGRICDENDVRVIAATAL